MSDEDVAAIALRPSIPSEAREASLDEVETLKTEYPEPDNVEVIEHFIDYDDEILEIFIHERGPAMDLSTSRSSRTTSPTSSIAIRPSPR